MSTQEFYPGSTFFIDPDGMSPLQLLYIFLTYGYVLYVSADMIGDGAELLLLVPDYADMVGSMVLPILGAIPDGMMVLFSGIGTLAVAQENVSVGIGALAGSTIMLLTLPWILSVYAAQVDMDEQGNCIGYKQGAGQKKTGKTKQTGCCFNEGVTKNAWLMFLTSLSYFVIQVPAYLVDDQKTSNEYDSPADYLAEVVKESKSENFAALCGIFVTTFFFFFYLYLQYLAATQKAPPLSCLKCLLPPPPAPISLESIKKNGLLPLISHYRDNFEKTGRLRVGAEEVSIAYAEEALEKSARLPKDLSLALKSLFTEFANKTPGKVLHCQDMRQLLGVTGLNFQPKEFHEKFAKVDTDNSRSLDMMEFLNFFFDMITGAEKLPYQTDAAMDKRPSEPAGDDEEEDDEMPEEFKDLPVAEQRKKIINASVKQMCIGTFLVLIFSDPMVDVLSQIGKMTGVPAFYVSFILAPLASNASELVSSYKLAAKKTGSSITQSLQTLEGAACMNNTFCLGIFYLLIYYQGLAWKFTAECLSIFFVQVLVFLLVIRNNTQSMSTALIIFSCYPVSLVFVAALEAMGLD